MATQWDTMHSARRAELEAQGVPPHIAMEQAAMETLRARQAQVAATIPRDADGRPSLDDDEAAFDASMADAMGQSNLAAAATPLQMEPEFGQDDGWQRWVDENPGSERQARYNPEGYALYRESVRDDHRKQAQEEMAKYGMGPEEGLTGAQRQARMDRRDADDRRRHNPVYEEQRIARMAERAGISMAEARAMVNAGYQRAGEDRQMHADSRFQVGSPNDTPPPAFDYYRDAYQELRDKGRDVRMADRAQRRAEVTKRAQLMLNPVAYLGRDDITPEQRQFVQDRLRGRRPGSDSTDPRVQVAEINARSTENQVAAERESRVSQQQWLETTRIAAEERAAERAKLDAETTRTFDAEQRQLDREARAAEGNAGREDAAAQRQAELDMRRQQHEENMLRLQQQDEAAQRRHEESMAAGQDQATQRQQQFEARFGLDKGKMEAEQGTRREDLERLERESLLASMESSYGPGIRAIAEGDDSTPESQQSLRKMAQASDQNWLGFWQADGQRLDNLLQRLGVSDPGRRRDLVERFGYGLENDFFGAGGDGRGGVLSYWMAGRPR
jgi:hypothetical protein